MLLSALSALFQPYAARYPLDGHLARILVHKVYGVEATKLIPTLTVELRELIGYVSRVALGLQV